MVSLTPLDRVHTRTGHWHHTHTHGHTDTRTRCAHMLTYEGQHHPNRSQMYYETPLRVALALGLCKFTELYRNLHQLAIYIYIYFHIYISVCISIYIYIYIQGAHRTPCE